MPRPRPRSRRKPHPPKVLRGRPRPRGRDSGGYARGYAPALLMCLAVGFALLTSLAPGVYAQSSPEEDQDANLTATTPDECVKPDPPSDNENANNYMDALERYNECLERTQNEAPEGENTTPAPGETSDNDPTAQNENATEPEECVEPPAPDDNDDAGNYMDARDAYEECLKRTGGGEGSTQEGDEDPAGGTTGCKEPEDDSVGAMEKYEDCLAEQGAMEDDEPERLAEDPGGFTGMAVGAFQAILEWLYGVTVEQPSKEVSRLITEEAFQSPDLDANGIGGFYEKFSDVVKPGAVLVMLYVGYLMMYQGASYNANVTVQNVLPKIFVFFAMIGFLPELMGMLNDLTQALSKSFVSQGTVETFLTGQGSAAHSGVEGGFLAVIANAAAFVMMLLVVFVCGIKNILQTQLYVLSPLAMLLWAAPGLSDIAGAWARAMIACTTLPLVFAVEFAIGAVMINNPGSVFGEGLGNDSVIGSVIVTIVVLYVVWRTPKHMLAWSLTGYSASPGIVATMTKSVVLKSIPVPRPA